MLDFLRKHTIVIMAAMALVFVGLMSVSYTHLTLPTIYSV